jgi:hypothetical protein
MALFGARYLPKQAMTDKAAAAYIAGLVATQRT